MQILYTATSATLNTSFSLGKWMHQSYIGGVNALFRAMKPRFNIAAGAIATFLVEPLQGIKAGLLMTRLIDPKRVKNLNPEYLTSEQQKTSLVFLLHGDGSTYKVFVPMIEAINKAHPSTHIYAMDVKTSSGMMKRKIHIQQVVNFFKNEIISRYPHEEIPHVTLIGHSSGGDFLHPLITKLCEENINFNFTAIKIGSLAKVKNVGRFADSPKGKYYEIAGSQDALVRRVSHLNPNRQHIISTGHLGLLFHPDTHHYVNELIA